MPSALVLAFNAKMGILGLWLGFSIACIILDIGFAMIISCPNWYKIAEEVKRALNDKNIAFSALPAIDDVKRLITPRPEIKRKNLLE